MLGTITITVGQRDSENMIEKDDVDNSLVARSASSVQDVQETVHEIIEQMPLSEDNIEELEPPTESQSNDVGFKKVFKFVGFKFTVKKDKNDKSDPVELLTVKKDEDDGVETNGADECQDSGSENEALPKETESTQLVGTDEESQRESADPEEGKSSEEEKQEKGNKSSEPENISSFKKFFSLGWAGWRKKTSFRKSKEEEPEISEKKKEQGLGKGDVVEIYEGKKEDATEQLTVSEHLPPQEAIDSIKDSSMSENEKVHRSPEDQVQEAQISYEEKVAPLATEVFDEKVETVAEVHVSTVEEQEQTDQSSKVEQAVGSLFIAAAEMNADLQKVEVTEKLVKTRELVCASGDDCVKLVEPSLEQSALCQQHEGITNEVEILSSQERGRLQGSPLKKLFTGTGLKKLSGKKHKGKRGDDEIKPEESGEFTQVSEDSPETPEEQKGESSASSPEELAEVTSVEKDIVEAPQEVEIEEEGTTSDGERKREGVTPWASFKKMVTPKKRVRRLSESDKEDEVEKVKSATLSSTESAVSDNQEEMKGHGDDQKTEEPKRKVDTSVSWEALICVGSSKKRARKSSSSDEEGGSKVVSGDSQKTEDVGKNKESGTEITHLHSHEGDQGQINSSPELAGSPLEGEGVSTWVSFKRLVTPRKKSKSKMEERNEESVTISGIEHSASDIEPVKEESWVSIKKLIPGRRKKRLDGKQEQVTVEEDHTGVNEDDSDIPAVVPLSEYDAAEQEKIEAQQAKTAEAAKISPLQEVKSGQVEGPGTEETTEGLVHAVGVTVVEGERAVTSIEERSPSWISAKITEPVEEATDQPKQQTEEIFEKEVLVEVPVTKTLPDIKDTGSDTIVSELELTSEAVTAPEEAAEMTEASCAEETTEMVSAVSQLTDSPDTTEEATPVQEVEDDTPDLEALKQRTQEVIEAVIEKVKQAGESEVTETLVSGDTVLTVQSLETKIPAKVNVKEAEQSGDHQEISLEIGEATGLDDSKVLHAEVQEQVQAAKSEDVTINDGQEIIVPSETFNKFNEVERSIEVKECKSYNGFTTYQAETTGIETSQIPIQQITPVEISTDEGSLVIHFEETSIKQQEGSDVDDSVPALGSEIVETTVVAVSTDKPPESPGFQSSQGNKEQSKVEEVPVPTEEQIVGQMGQNLSETEVVQDSSPFVDQEVKDRITAKEQVSLDTEVMELLDQTKIDQVELKDEKVTEKDKLEYENNSEKVELQISSHSASVEEEVLVQEDLVSSEMLKVQSSEAQEASLPLRAAAIAEKAVAEAVKLSETAENLGSVAVELVTEKIPSESMQDSDSGGSDQAVLMEKQSLAGSILQEKAKTVVLSAITETIKSSGIMKRPEEESQKLSDAASVEIVSQEVKPTLTAVELGKDEDDILTIRTQSTRIVQNVIQTAVDQLVSAKDLNSQTFALDAEEQAQIRKSEEEGTLHESERNESELIVQCEMESVTTEDLGLAAVEQTSDAPVISGIYKEASISESSETIVAIEVQIPELKLGEQQHEEAAPQLEEKKEAIETKTEPKIDSAASGEVPDKSKHIPKGENEDDIAIDRSDDPKLVPEESNDLCKGSIDSNGPKRKETVEGLECQERLVLQVEKEIYNQSVEDTKTQTQEEVHKHDEPCESPPKSAPKES
ncbi:A-kinase anchor protein 12 isoform X2 [Trichosurus vulpecula]|uniref:A-kinase anchor protein 12 isoform X2 n=1 Tax=Trichosurus vulpecula TaxID=9337 RepID=UPI00186B1B4E|nr:A-kinase anchor protein 12 isoform X2 [Trichosurus vulpecula]